MFGKNVRLKLVDEPNKLIVKEVFYTLQGECLLAGRPAVFVRMSGCHLDCSFCDTDFEGGTEMTRIELYNNITEVADGRTRLVVFTGGEPLRQNLATIVAKLHMYEWKIQIETAGSFWWDWMTGVVVGSKAYHFNDFTVVCSPKTHNIHKEVQRQAHAFKYIIKHDQISDEDGLPTCSPVSGCSTIWRGAERDKIWVQPEDSYSTTTNALNVTKTTQIALRYGYNLSLQTHKIVNVP